jgi:ribonuclease P/MRP protein subunit RPP40
MYHGRDHTSKSKASSSWFVLSTSALGKQAVEGRDGFAIAAAPNLMSAPTGAKENEASESKNLHAICWEYVGATAIDQ